MTAPAVAARQFLIACAMGLGLGLFYGFLRPLRRRHVHLADLLFLPALFYGWLALGFGICGGDLRIVPTLGLGLGAVAWECSIGRLLRPVFAWLWGILFQILALPGRIFKKIFAKIAKFAKFLLASGKKAVIMRTMKKPKRETRKGGRRHGKETEHFQPDPSGI